MQNRKPQWQFIPVKKQMMMIVNKIFEKFKLNKLLEKKFDIVKNVNEEK